MEKFRTKYTSKYFFINILLFIKYKGYVYMTKLQESQPIVYIVH